MDQESKDTDYEVNKTFGRCRCCLELCYVRNMWTEYPCEGAQEIYGEMLMETFSIAWESKPNSQEHICDMCIDRLRDAHSFKREVLASEKLLQEGVIDYVLESVKEEQMSEMDEYEYVTEEYLEEPVCKEEVEDEDEYQEEFLEEEYEEVEYLDEEIGSENQPESHTSKGKAGESSKKSKEKPKPKRRQRNNDVNVRNYRNYTEDTLRQCVEAALCSDKSLSEMAALYGVPRKTLTARVYNIKNGPKPETPKEIEKIMNQERHYNFVQEIKKVLRYTNAVPFKIKSGRYYCAYCYTTIDSFDDPSDLRVHTQIHDEERISRLDQILRPQFLNEILRVDIDLFSCEVCSTPIENWNDMFIHLKETHELELDQAYTKLIPYKLKGNMYFCALCEADFPSFQFLDAHMNAHYCNYMCSECGDTFVTENRLKHHLLIHNTGKFPCNHCGKVFTLEKYKKKHEAMVHKEAKMFKCIDCSEAFHTEYERHLHVVAEHKERVRVSTCEFCGKTYDWKPYYLAHLRKVHSKVKKNVCMYCSKRFVSKHELKMHELRHTGNGRHVCVFCDKRFVTLTELKKHFKRHEKEIQYIDTDDNTLVISK